MFALVHPDGSVLETQREKFPVHPAMKWIDIGDNADGISRGWSYDGVNFVAPAPVTPPIRRPQLSVESLTELLVEKKVLSAQDVEGKKK